MTPEQEGARCPGVTLDGPCKHAEQVQRIGLVRHLGEHGAVDLLGLFAAAGPVMLDALLQLLLQFERIDRVVEPAARAALLHGRAKAREARGGGLGRHREYSFWAAQNRSVNMYHAVTSLRS